MCFFMYFGPKNLRKSYIFSNLSAMHVEETLLPFSLLFYLQILLFSIITLTFWALFWVASESHLLFSLTAKSLSSISPDSSSKKVLDFVKRYLILIAPSVSNNFIKIKSNLNYKRQFELLFPLLYVIP